MIRYYKDTSRYGLPEAKHTLVEGFFDNHITLQQYSKKLFLVRYGMEVHSNLTYDQACNKLGEAIMHHLAAEGKMAVG